MAVEKSKMIARLKAIFPKINLSKERMDMIMDKLAKKPEDDADDAAIDSVINDFNGIFSFEEIAKTDDKSRKLASDKAKLEKEAKAKGKKADEETDENEELEIDDDAPEWAKKMMLNQIKQNKVLQSEIDGIKTGNLTGTKKQEAQEAFEKSPILKKMDAETQKKWIGRMDLESETSFEDQTKELETEFASITQTSADGTQHGGSAGQGSADVTVKQKDVDDVVDKMNL